MSDAENKVELDDLQKRIRQQIPIDICEGCAASVMPYSGAPMWPTIPRCYVCMDREEAIVHYTECDEIPVAAINVYLQIMGEPPMTEDEIAHYTE